MFNRLRRAFNRATKLSRAGKMLSAAAVLQEVAVATVKVATVKPARKRAAAKPRLRKAAAAKPQLAALPIPRAALGETVRRITAGGMPAKTTPLADKPAALPRGSFRRAVYSSDQGQRSYKIYIPPRIATAAQPDRPMPLLVMLHGCTQTPDDFAKGTGMNLLADAHGVIVAYPAQPVGANRNRCWNWFKPADQGRDRGEPALIAGITRQILRDHPADPRRVYVAGLSAGGAAAAIVANAYPDIFAAVGVHSGLPIGAAQDPASAFVAMRAGSFGSRQSVAMPTIIFHGDADQIVHPRNGRAVAARSLAAFPRLTEVVRNGGIKGGQKYSKTAHRAQNRKSYCEYWSINGAGHAWSGGQAEGSFTDPKGPDASREMLRFFLQHRL